MTEKLRIMSFIQNEFDHAPFIRLAEAPARDHWQSRSAAADFRRPTTRLSLRRLGESAVTSGMPALVIPFLFTLGSGTSLGWPLIALSLAVLPLALWWFYRDGPVMQMDKAEAQAGFSGPARLTVLGNASLTALLMIAAADHAAAAVASLAIGEPADPTSAGRETMVGLVLPLAIIASLASAACFLARRGATPPLRVMLVIEGITLALTLIVLANYTAFGKAAMESLPISTQASGSGTVAIAAIAETVGLAALSPILSAGIAFCCFTGALASLKRADLMRVRFRLAAGSLD